MNNMAEYPVVRYLIASKLFRVSMVVVILGAFGAIFLYRWSSEPVTTIITPEQVSVNQSDRRNDYQPVETRLFSTKVPGAWKVRKTSDDTNASKLTAFGSSNPQGKVAIVSDSLPTDGLSGVADYNLRSSQPTLYRRTSINGISNGVIVFENKQQTVSYTAFLLHDDSYASVTTSSTVTTEASKALLAQVLDDWQWF